MHVAELYWEERVRTGMKEGDRKKMGRETKKEGKQNISVDVIYRRRKISSPFCS